MLNVRAYLPSMEDFDSLPETLTDDITIDGEPSHVEGLPEEIVMQVDNSVETNESDGVIEDDNAAMNAAREEKEESEQGSTEETDENQGDSTEDTQVESETKDDQSEVEQDLDESGDTTTEELEEEEDETTEVQYAIESYTGLLTNAGATISEQAAAFLEVGLSHLERRRSIATVSTESFEATPTKIHTARDSAPFVERLERIAKSLPIL